MRNVAKRRFPVRLSPSAAKPWRLNGARGLLFSGLMPSTSASIDGLRAELVPHCSWAQKRWFYASPIWFYHRRRRRDEPLVANRRFYELVDPDLRELCHLFLRHGLVTTPSCQGHFYERPRFERIWDELSMEIEQIRGKEGLVVTDCETDRKYRFRDENFELPWKDKDAFCAEAMAHQATGYLGSLVPPERQELIDRLERAAYENEKARFMREEQLSRELNATFFAFTIHADDPTERMELWRIATERIKRVLDEQPVSDAAKSCAM
jgi:hypothetical protein